MVALPDTVHALDTGHIVDHNLIVAALTSHDSDIELFRAAIELLDERCFDVKAAEFGAVGDGIVDDTAAFIAARNAAFAYQPVSGTGGGVVVVPPGRYPVSSPIFSRPETRTVGTAQAGAASTVTLAVGASAVDDAYKYALVTITGGTGAGQSRGISAYVGATKVATVSLAWSVTPDGTSTYSILTFGTEQRSVSFVGVPNASIIEASNTFSGEAVVYVQYGNAAFGDRYGYMDGLIIDAKTYAPAALYVGLAVERDFRRLQLLGGTVANHIIDAAQNCFYESIHYGSGVTNQWILNGAGNNEFHRCEMQDGTAYGLRGGVSGSYSGHSYALGGVGAGPSQNLYVKCLSEQGGDSCIPLEWEDGTYNTFEDFIFSTPSTSTAPYVGRVGAGSNASLNFFERAVFNRNDTSGNPFFVNYTSGFKTALSRCHWTGGLAGSDAIQTYNQLLISEENIPSTSNIQNMAGNQFDNVQFLVPARVSGTSAQRAGYRSTPRGVRPPYWNTDLSRWEAYNGAAWYGLSGNVVTATYGASIAADASAADYFIVPVTNGTAFTLAAPTNPVAGRLIRYEIQNNAGGAHGVISFNAALKNQGAVTIANTKRQVLSFVYNGSSWVEVARTADIT